MAVGRTKSGPANGAGKKAKAAVSSANGSNANDSASPTTPTAEVSSQQPTFAAYGPGKPDKVVYDREQEQIKVEIDALQVKVSAVKDKINLTSKSGPGNDRRTALRAELDGIRGQQSTSKASRGRIFDQLKALQDGIQKKIKDLNAAKAKVPYKTVAEVDERIKQLEKQVETGSLKIVDEKRALAEISQCKRSRRIVEGFQAEQDSIETDRAAADELRKQLDDPEAKAASERYDAIKAELDELKKEGDEAFANRNKLFDERNALQGQLDTLYNQKRESAQRYREANDKYWTKVNEDRARRAERARAQRAAEEEAKKKEQAGRLREEAAMPAFQAQIEDCQTLIDHLSGKSSDAPALSTLTEKTDLTGVPKLELRKVEAGPGEGLIARKKKGEEEESYFVGGNTKVKKGRKGGVKPSAPSDSTGTEASGSQLNIPLPTLTALLTLSISPPTSPADIPRVVEDLKSKKAWYETNQARVTAENKEKAEAKIRQLIGKANGKTDTFSQQDDLKPPNGGGEHPAEPAPTPSTTDKLSAAVPTDSVVEKLETVQEHDANGEEHE
ncbi:hypothetical protein AcW1_004278 [Taiwanofungus camphoratus]|nr:hypothetical protein AcW1_004278 [Antrodia cinnamomea]